MLPSHVKGRCGYCEQLYTMRTKGALVEHGLPVDYVSNPVYGLIRSDE